MLGARRTAMHISHGVLKNNKQSLAYALRYSCFQCLFVRVDQKLILACMFQAAEPSQSRMYAQLQSRA